MVEEGGSRGVLSSWAPDAYFSQRSGLRLANQTFLTDFALMQRRRTIMNRRELLERVGLGSLATASLLEALATPASAAADTPVNFHFLSVSQAGTVDGVGHRVTMGGDGA